MRILTMVGWYSYWDGYEIAPVSFNNQNNKFVAAWPDYWQQFRDCIDLIYDQGMRAEVTIFADAQLMPNGTDRTNHMNNVLANLVGREHKVILLEVANEYWQNGFPDPGGIATVRQYGQYLADRTTIPVALSSPSDTSDAGIATMYGGSAADVATVHFSRDTGTVEGGWLPVRDCWRTGVGSVPPMSSNEPIGPGSSVSSENDPIKLVMAAAFAWGANLPMYVYHTSAGVRGDSPFQSMAGVNDFVHLNEILPPDFAGWVRNDGRETAAPFTAYSNGQANKWWPEVSGATSGAVRNTGATKGGEFITLPIGILAGGVELEARRPVSFQAFNPLTGQVVDTLSKSTGERFTLPQGPQAYILKGTFLDVGSSAVWIDLGSPDVPQGMTHVANADGDTTAATIGGRTCRRNVNPAEDHYFYFGVDDWFAFQASRPDLYVVVDYYDSGTATLTLQYDSNTGDTLPAFYKAGGSVTLTNSGTWKTAVFHVTDAYFGNRQNAGADLRIGSVGSTFYLDVVRVMVQAPAAPRIGAVPPDPEILHVGTAYARQLTLTQGSPAPTWSVVQGPSGLTVSGTGLVGGWTPGPGQFGDFVVEVEAANILGEDLAAWTIRVVSWTDFDQDGDTDQEDFGHFQVCLSDQGLPYLVGCADADFDGDLDVDAHDFGVFQACLNGSQQAPACAS